MANETYNLQNQVINSIIIIDNKYRILTKINRELTGALEHEGNNVATAISFDSYDVIISSTFQQLGHATKVHHHEDVPITHGGNLSKQMHMQYNCYTSHLTSFLSLIFHTDKFLQIFLFFGQI